MLKYKAKLQAAGCQWASERTTQIELATELEELTQPQAGTVTVTVTANVTVPVITCSDHDVQSRWQQPAGGGRQPTLLITAAAAFIEAIT